MRFTRRLVATAATTAMAAAVMLAGSPAAFADAGQAKAKHILISQGMPAELATKVAADPTTVVKNGKVFVQGVDSGEAMKAAESASANVIVSAAKGSDYWYGVAINSLGQPKTVVYLRYSWSWMWWLKDHWDYISMLSAAACGWLPGALAAACGSIVAVSYLPLKNLIQSGLNQKKCVRIRYAAPPLYDVSLTQLTLVTCRI